MLVWWGAEGALIYKPHEMSLKVVLFLPSFSRTVQFDFLPVPGFIGPQVLGFLSRIEIKFQLIEWASNSILYWLAMPTNLYHYCTSPERSSLKTKGCVAVYLMLWQQKIRTNEHGEEKGQRGLEETRGHLTRGDFRDHTGVLCSRLWKYIQAKAM